MIPIGSWQRPPCQFCGVRLMATSNPVDCPQFLGIPGMWACKPCWTLRRKAWLLGGVRVLAEQTEMEWAA